MVLFFTERLASLVRCRSTVWNHFHINLRIIIMILIIMICILLAGGLLCWLLSRWNKMLVKWIALITVLADFFIVVNLWLQHSGENYVTANRWMIDFKMNWIPTFGISFHFAL